MFLSHKLEPAKSRKFRHTVPTIIKEQVCVRNDLMNINYQGS